MTIPTTNAAATTITTMTAAATSGLRMARPAAAFSARSTPAPRA